MILEDKLNLQASVLVDAQTDIKTAIKQGVLSGAPLSLLKERAQKIISTALRKIHSTTLKEDARVSLMRFANGAYGRFKSTLATIPVPRLPAVVVLMRGITESGQKTGVYYPKTQGEREAIRQLQSIAPTGGGESISAPIEYKTRKIGLPLDEFHKVYMNRVSNALDGLAQENALDPNDFRGRNTLRNLAEMQVRYERHQDEIAQFRDKGTKLVVCSVHADCSDRCAQWQGRVYSLDGTSGTTADGRKFQPLENATDAYYTTKAGRTYKNGLLGFNCRHKLVEYRVGMGIPRVSAAEQKKEYAITKRQRERERAVIRARENALAQKDADVAEWRKWKKIAKERYNEYKKFSADHERAYYPDRVKIL